MTNVIYVNKSTLQQWIDEKRDIELIKKSLLADGLDEDAIDANLKEFRKLKNAKRQFIGFIVLGSGATLGFISCVLSVLNPVPELYYWFLYGITSLALVLIFLGLYFIFE